MAMSTSHKPGEFAEGLKKFDDRYGELVRSGKLREGNEPRILHHGQSTDDVIVLVHGLSDSPFYMLAIAKIGDDKYSF